MIRVCIVEDDNADRRKTEECLQRFATEYGYSISVEKYSDAESFLSDRIECDLVLMDIELPGIDGMTAAKRLRERDRSVMIIFITNLAQCAISGYEVNAFDFLVKPLEYYNFVLKFSRAFECLKSAQKREVWVPSRQGRRLVRANEVKYVEVTGHMLVFHTLTDKISGSGSLRAISEKFDGLNFCMCNQCYLVNLEFVTEIDGDTVVLGDERLRISSPRRKEFLKALNNFLGAGGGIR